MKIQNSTDYAIRILLYLHENGDELHTAASIAKAVGMTYPFFVQIANQMQKRGLLSSVQGRNGGYQLGRPARDISFYDVFACIEGELHMSRCLLNDNRCDYGQLKQCKLHHGLRVLQDNIILQMSQLTITQFAS